MKRERPILLSLCDYSGAWSRPFVRLGWEVVMLDEKHPVGDWRQRDGSWRVGADVTRIDGLMWLPDAILAAPPCTCFCRASSRWWARQDARGETARNIEIMRACLRICGRARRWWALENPPGRHRRLIPELGPPAWQFQPWQYGDPWGKQTYIWGTATKPPVVAPVEPAPTRRTPNGRTQGRIAFMSSSWKAKREETPGGFAKAFAEANQSLRSKLAADQQKGR